MMQGYTDWLNERFANLLPDGVRFEWEEMTTDDVAEILDEPLPVRVRKVLDTAVEYDWCHNPVVSLTIRLTRLGDDVRHPAEMPALPFFATWTLDTRGDKRSWRFAGARAKNGQALSYGDIFTYLEDPSVIYPEPPEDTCQWPVT